MSPNHVNVPTIPVDKIMAYEMGELDNEDVIDLFQTLVDTGIAWQLQGSYARTAGRLIEAGHVVYNHARPAADLTAE